MFRIANYVMLVLFVSWAYFQLNDPDPLLWVAMYGLAALACALHAAGRLPWWAPAALAAACLAGAGYHTFHIVAERQFIFDEMGREMMGMLIVAAWTGTLALRARQPKPMRSRPDRRPG